MALHSPDEVIETGLPRNGFDFALAVFSLGQGQTGNSAATSTVSVSTAMAGRIFTRLKKIWTTGGSAAHRGCRVSARSASSVMWTWSFRPSKRQIGGDSRFEHR
jgi:hypothetical protein